MPKRRAKPSKRSATALLRRWLCRGLALGVVAGLLATVVPIALLRVWAPPTTAFMWQSHRSDPATGRACTHIDYQWVPWRELAPKLPWAVLVAEDQRFLAHRGFDVKAIADALDARRSGGRLRGASTVSQQVAKNLFLWPGRSALRKGLEAWLTVWIELLWPKRRIIEMHLNIAQFGPCVFGGEAASQRYFGRPVALITARQAALLAAVLPSPGKMRANDPGPYTVERAQRILALMHLPDGPSYLRGL
jgi:monofunctional biosynthetic peptidoglycan transglycosylase